MLDVTVVRSRWARGRKNGSAALLNEQGTMCCLGFVGEACGINKTHLLNVDSPMGVGNGYVSFWPPKLLDCDNTDSGICLILMQKNDILGGMREDVREKELTALGKHAGINFTFVD